MAGLRGDVRQHDSLASHGAQALLEEMADPGLGLGGGWQMAQLAIEDGQDHVAQAGEGDAGPGALFGPFTAAEIDEVEPGSAGHQVFVFTGATC